MTKKALFADVILPLPLDNLFIYNIPEEFKNIIFRGCRVVVQFGAKKIYTALVKNIHNIQPTDYEVKDILSVLDEKPIINDFQFQFWDWIAQYYMCSSGEVYKAALPSGLKLESESNIIINENVGFSELSEKEKLLIEILHEKNVISISEFHSMFKEHEDLKILKSLVNKKAVSIVEKLKETYKPKTEKFIRLNEKYKSEKQLNGLFDILEKFPKQLEILMHFIQLTSLVSKKISYIGKKELMTEKKLSQSSLQTLVKKDIFQIFDLSVSRLDNKNDISPELHKLNKIQDSTLSQIIKGFEKKDISLLFGVTSSGKTEIYIHLIKKYLDEGKQVLYLLPEIALTTQIINRLKRAFGNSVGIYHSRFSDSEKVETWMKVQQNDGYKLVLGVRSSIYLPFDNLGLIIIDEEHENTYKQYDPAPRYHARDCAIVLAKFHNAKVLLGTATPSAETYYNAINGKYDLVELMHRFKEIKMPEILLSDIKDARRRKIMHGHFTPLLLENIYKALSDKEQVILFQNRRGFSPFIECNVCGWVPKCEYCDVSLTYHKSHNKMVCHYCGYSKNIPKLCSVCGSKGMRTMGFGTEKIEDDISLLCPNHKIARLDLDTANSRKSYERIIGDFENRKIDILIGTQMVSKGLDFDNVSLVGIMNADNLLNYPDFRAYERSYQLMTQVSGRAGRKQKQGKVIIQTSDINHPIIQHVKNNRFRNMFDEQMEERDKFRYPPFYRLIKITLKHKKTDKLNISASTLTADLRKTFGNRILGPEAPIIGRIQQFYLKQILVKIEREKSYSKAKELIRKSINKLLTDQNTKSLLIVIDVDPM
ncbi:MAG: primosomal protein N' [Bacteroidota bacterium]